MGWLAGPLVFWSSLSWLSGSLTTFRWLTQKDCQWVLPVCSSRLKICTFQQDEKNAISSSYFPQIQKYKKYEKITQKTYGPRKSMQKIKNTKNIRKNINMQKYKSTKNTKHTKLQKIRPANKLQKMRPAKNYKIYDPRKHTNIYHLPRRAAKPHFAIFSFC